MNITLYHGTNATNIINVIDYPKMNNSINGRGFYLTNNIETAKKYGKTVLKYEIEVDIEMIVRPIDQRYVEGLATYEECVKGGMEYVIVKDKELFTLVDECEISIIK